MQALYYSLIHTHLLYSLSDWGSTHPSYLKQLITLQNKAVKLIGGGLYNDKASPFYSQLKILKLPYLYKLEIGKFVNAHFKNRLPLNISKYLTLTSNTSLPTTRTIQNNKNNLYTPRYHTARLQKSIKYQGVKIWNKIPSEIQNISPKFFKKSLKIIYFKFKMNKLSNDFYYVNHKTKVQIKRRNQLINSLTTTRVAADSR